MFGVFRKRVLPIVFYLGSITWKKQPTYHRISERLRFSWIFPGTLEIPKIFRIFCVFRNYLGTFEKIWKEFRLSWRSWSGRIWKKTSSESRNFGWHRMHRTLPNSKCSFSEGSLNLYEIQYKIRQPFKKKTSSCPRESVPFQWCGVLCDISIDRPFKLMEKYR